MVKRLFGGKAKADTDSVDAARGRGVIEESREIVVALDLIGVGDVRLAVEVLLEAIEDEGGPRALPTCPVCGVKAWPGNTRAHIWSRHAAAEEAAA